MHDVIIFYKEITSFVNKTTTVEVIYLKCSFLHKFPKDPITKLVKYSFDGWAVRLAENYCQITKLKRL